MVMSFWLLPGLDACPAGDDGDVTQTSLELFGNSEAVAQSAAAAEGAARGLLSSAVGGMFSSLSSPPAVGGEEAGAAEDSAGFASEGGGYGFEGEDESCFEGSNAVGSVRTILQVQARRVSCGSVVQRTGCLRPRLRGIDALCVPTCSCWCCSPSYP